MLHCEYVQTNLTQIIRRAVGGEHGSGFDVERARWIAGQIKPAHATGTHIVIMVGGGNYARGAQLANDSVRRITADNIGMLATMMNALALADVFNAVGLPTRAISNVKADQVIDQFTHRRAVSHLDKIGL